MQSGMVEILEQAPDESIMIDNDEQAKQFLFELGMIDKFLKNPKANTKTNTQLATHFSHRTHYVIAMYFSGHDKPEANGYLIHCIPKSKFTREEALDAVSRRMADMGVIIQKSSIPRDSSHN